MRVTLHGDTVTRARSTAAGMELPGTPIDHQVSRSAACNGVSEARMSSYLAGNLS